MYSVSIPRIPLDEAPRQTTDHRDTSFVHSLMVVCVQVKPSVSQVHTTVPVRLLPDVAWHATAQDILRPEPPGFPMNRRSADFRQGVSNGQRSASVFTFVGQIPCSYGSCT